LMKILLMELGIKQIRTSVILEKYNP
jgi:hypothetical protein